jgi:hypothetical protein
MLRGVDDFPDVLLTEHRGQFAVLSAEPIVKGDGVFNHMSVEELQSCGHSATTAGGVALGIFQIQQIVFDAVFGEFVRGLMIVAGKTFDGSQVAPLSVLGKVPQLHGFDHLLS